MIEEREWEVRHEGNWMDREGEEFMREYLNIPQPTTTSAYQFEYMGNCSPYSLLLDVGPNSSLEDME